MVTFDKFDLNPILVNFNKLKLYQYPESIIHPFPTFVHTVLGNLIYVTSLHNSCNYEITYIGCVIVFYFIAN